MLSHWRLEWVTTWPWLAFQAKAMIKALCTDHKSLYTAHVCVNCFCLFTSQTLIQRWPPLAPVCLTLYGSAVWLRVRQQSTQTKIYVWILSVFCLAVQSRGFPVEDSISSRIDKTKLKQAVTLVEGLWLTILSYKKNPSQLSFTQEPTQTTKKSKT